MKSGFYILSYLNTTYYNYWPFYMFAYRKRFLATTTGTATKLDKWVFARRPVANSRNFKKNLTDPLWNLTRDLEIYIPTRSATAVVL